MSNSITYHVDLEIINFVEIDTMIDLQGRQQVVTAGECKGWYKYVAYAAVRNRGGTNFWGETIYFVAPPEENPHIDLTDCEVAVEGLRLVVTNENSDLLVSVQADRFVPKVSAAA